MQKYLCKQKCIYALSTTPVTVNLTPTPFGALSNLAVTLRVFIASSSMRKSRLTQDIALHGNCAAYALHVQSLCEFSVNLYVICPKLNVYHWIVKFIFAVPTWMGAKSLIYNPYQLKNSKLLHRHCNQNHWIVIDAFICILSNSVEICGLI